MDLEKHANRYYKSLCLCEQPVRSKFCHDLCAICGGIIPRWRRLEMEMQQEQDSSLLLVVLLLLVFAAIVGADALFPYVLDGAFAQIGR